MSVVVVCMPAALAGPAVPPQPLLGGHINEVPLHALAAGAWQAGGDRSGGGARRPQGHRPGAWRLSVLCCPGWVAG